MKIGIFGGTFDPCHAGHYEIVKKVLNDKLVDKVIVIPSIVKYYRSEKDLLFTNEQKRIILQKWFSSIAYVDSVVLDFHEYDLEEDSTFNDDSRRYIDMLDYVIYSYSKKYFNSKIEFYTIIGQDSYETFTCWHKWSEILNKSRLIVIGRDVKPIFSSISRDYVELVPTAYNRYIDKKFTNMSASKIRQHLVSKCSSETCLGMNVTPFSLYLDEIDEYLKTGKTYDDIQNELKQNEYKDNLKNMNNKTKQFIDDVKFDFSDLKGKINNFFEKVISKQEKTIAVNSFNRHQVFNDKDSNELLASTPIFDVVKGKEIEKGFRPIRVKSKDWVAIVVEQDNMFLMEKQLRHGLNKELEEFPCGVIEDGEQPFEAALRELKEETGMDIDTYDMKYLGKFAANPGFMTNYMHYFYVIPKKYEQGDTKLDEHEHLTSYWKNKIEAFADFMSSKGSTLMGCGWMLLIKNGIINEWND